MPGDASRDKPKRDTSHLVALPPGMTPAQTTREPDPPPVARDDSSPPTPSPTQTPLPAEEEAPASSAEPTPGHDEPTPEQTELEAPTPTPAVRQPHPTGAEHHGLQIRRLVDGERRYLPLVGAMPVDAWSLAQPRNQADGIRLLSPPGRWVHAVESGIVVDVTATGSVGGEHVSLRTADGTVHHYHGLEPGSVSVRRGDTLHGGEPMARVATASQTGWTGLRFAVELADASWSNPYVTLVGLPDPAELVEAVSAPVVRAPVTAVPPVGPAERTPGEEPPGRRSSGSHLVADIAPQPPGRRDD